MNNAFNISELITKQIKGSISPEESKVLHQWINDSSENKNLFERASQDEHLLEKLDIYNLFDRDEAWLKVSKSLTEDKKVIPIHQRILRIAAVIIPFFILAYGAYYFLNNYEDGEGQIVVEEIQPGSEKATLVLADGTRIDLESEDSPKEILRDDIKIYNNFKILKYPEISTQKAIVYHELITPKGGKYGIILPDGSEVMLNAGSTLKYPTVFQGDKREVFLDGEAYLKVRKGTKPFLVSCNGMDVRVLGTAFNIEAYGDEKTYLTTLVEGKVKVTSNGLNDQILSPNEQALLNLENNDLTKMAVNANQYTSWIEGKFEFANNNLESVMKKLSRWYDFEYEFENPDARNFHFSARIDDKQDISTILDMLEMTTSVKFKVKNKKIVIL